MASLYENRTWIIPGGGNVGSGHSIGANESRHITLRPSGMDQAFTEVEILMLNPTTSVYQVTHASVGNLAATTKTENIATGFKTLVSSPVNVPAGDGLLNEGLDSILPGIVSLGRQTLSMAGGNGFQLAISMSEGAPLCIWGGEAIGYEWGLDKIPRDLSVTWSLDGGQNPFNVNPCIAVIFYGLSTPVVTLPFIGDSWIKSWGDLEQPFPGARGIPYRLEQRWRANVNISPVNFGRDGATTSVIAARAGWVLDNFAPRVLAVQYYSINNDMRGVGNVNVESDFQGIVDAMYPQPVLPLLLAGNNNGTSGWWAPVKALEDACVAARPETIDLSAPIVDETDGTIVSGYEYGTSHPNTDAYDVMEASSHLAIRTWCENYVEPVVEKFYSLRNTTLSSITLAGTEIIAANGTLRFYDTATDMFDGMDAIQQSMLSDATGVNYLLATGDLEFYEDGVASTSAAFYEVWGGLYNAWLLVKQASSYYTDARVRAAVLAGLSTADSSAVVATDSLLVAIGKLQARSDAAAYLAVANTFTAQQTVTVSANNAMLLNVTVNNAFTQAITAYNTALPTGGQFCFEFGTASSTNNMGHFGFLNVGGAGSNTNAITFGMYGANQLLTINATGLAKFSGKVVAAGGIGYDTGSGGTVTQGTSKSTGVTLNKLCGTITMNGAALTANTSVAFTLTNSTIANTDMVLVQHNSAGTLGSYDFCVTPGSGSASITVRNNSSTNRSEAIVLRFFVLKAVVA